MLQAHNHTFANRIGVWDAGQINADTQNGSGTVWQYYTFGSTASMNNTGGGDSQNLQPYRGLNHIIKV